MAGKSQKSRWNRNDEESVVIVMFDLNYTIAIIGGCVCFGVGAIIGFIDLRHKP